MELSYWQSRWRKGNIGFHLKEGYPGLEEHWPALKIPSDAIVLVPLCGKSIDMALLAARVDKVAGVEISEKAIHEFLQEQNLTAKTTRFADFSIYSTEKIELWCGDFFKFPNHKYPKFDLIYDKAALIALPKEIRKRYVKKIIDLSAGSAKILLHHFIYNEKEMNGPPFSVTQKELNLLFGQHFTTRVIEENLLDPEQFEAFKRRGLKSFLKERLLLLTPKKP